jgi:hypothetical protein
VTAPAGYARNRLKPAENSRALPPPVGAGLLPPQTASGEAALRPGRPLSKARNLFRAIEDLLELIEDLHGGQRLGDAGVGLAPFLDRREKLAILKFDPVH